MGYGYRVAEDAETVMGFPYEHFESTEPDECDDAHFWAWQDFKELVLSNLSDRWEQVVKGDWRREHPGGQVIAQSRLHELLIEEDQGGYGYAYISIVVRSDLPQEPVGDDPYIDEDDKRRGSLARSNLGRVAKGFFDRLAQETELRVPNGYTSSPYGG